MRIFNKKEEVLDFRKVKHLGSKTIGLVPTMGALHQGHLALVEAALSQNHMVMVSIFVNPTQFDREEDLINYPKTLDSDISLLKTVSDTNIVVYAPSVEDIYGQDVNARHFDFGGLEFEMEGKYRTGHFDGVGTIITRLFEIVQPDRAYFGEKDFQQLAIIKKLVALENLPVEIVPVEIQRANDGLAMSSRNMRLTDEHRAAAPFIYKTLKKVQEKFGTENAKGISEWVEGQFDEHPLLELEYFIIADTENLKPIEEQLNKKTYRAFIAAYAGAIRLIDNIALK